MANFIASNLLSKWNQLTLDALANAQDNAPLASGVLVRSGVSKKAQLRGNTVSSQIEFRAPYARFLEEGENLRFKKAGEISYYLKGVKIRKEKQGGAKFAQMGIDSVRPQLIKAVNRAVEIAWDKI